MEKPLVTVITVCFNSEKTIEKTIKSVVNQNYDKIEYLIIDGGSTDETLKTIRFYYNKYPNIIKYISEVDDGIYHAMNKGINMANGDIIGIINSDDWYEINTIKKVVNFFYEHNNIDLVHGILRYIENDKEFRLEGVNDEFLFKKMLPHPTCFIKKDIYNKYGLYDTQYDLAADYEYMLRLKQKNVSFKKMNEILANFRINGATSKSYNSNIETFYIKYKYNYISYKKYIIKFIEFKIKELMKKIVKFC